MTLCVILPPNPVKMGTKPTGWKEVEATLIVTIDTNRIFLRLYLVTLQFQYILPCSDKHSYIMIFLQLCIHTGYTLAWPFGAVNTYD